MTHNVDRGLSAFDFKPLFQTSRRFLVPDASVLNKYSQSAHLQLSRRDCRRDFPFSRETLQTPQSHLAFTGRFPSRSRQAHRQHPSSPHGRGSQAFRRQSGASLSSRTEGRPGVQARPSSKSKLAPTSNSHLLYPPGLLGQFSHGVTSRTLSQESCTCPWPSSNSAPVNGTGAQGQPGFSATLFGLARTGPPKPVQCQRPRYVSGPTTASSPRTRSVAHSSSTPDFSTPAWASRMVPPAVPSSWSERVLTRCRDESQRNSRRPETHRRSVFPLVAGISKEPVSADKTASRP